MDRFYLSQTAPRGFTTRSAYERLGRVISTTVPVSGTLATRQYGYDALGRAVDAWDPLGCLTRTGYDGLDRPVTVTVNYQDGVYEPDWRDEDLSTSTQYDAVGNRVAVTGANGVVTTYEYDGLNRLAAVVENARPGQPADAQTNVRTSYAYDSAGHRPASTRPSRSTLWAGTCKSNCGARTPCPWPKSRSGPTRPAW